MNISVHKLRSLLLFRVVPALVLALIAGLVGAGFWSYRLPALARIARHEFARTGADSIALSAVSITPWRGIGIDSLYLRVPLADGRSLEFFSPRTKITYHSTALLFEGKHIRSILESAASRARTAGNPAAAAGAILGLLNNQGFTRVIKGAGTSNAWCRLMAGRRPVVELRDFDGNIRLIGRDSASADGSFDAGMLCFGGRYYLVRPSASLRIEQGRVDFSKVKAFYCEGTLRGSAVVDVPASRMLKGEFKLSNVNLGKWYETQRNQGGSLSGRMNVSFTADTSRLTLDSIKGAGECRIKDLVAIDLPMQRDLVILLPIQQLRHLEFGVLGSDFSIQGGRLMTPDLKGSGDPMDIAASGWVSLVDGSFSDSVNCLLTKKFSRSLPDVVRESLLPHDNGRLGFECTISGTLASPSLVLNKQILERAVRNVFEKLGNELKDLFR